MVGEWKLYNFGVSGNYLQISETVHFREVYRLKKKRHFLCPWPERNLQKTFLWLPGYLGHSNKPSEVSNATCSRGTIPPPNLGLYPLYFCISRNDTFTFYFGSFFMVNKFEKLLLKVLLHSNASAHKCSIE